MEMEELFSLPVPEEEDIPAEKATVDVEETVGE